MSRLVYFAYGSNMLSHRLRARCPSAEAIGPAVARGFDFSFGKKSDDGSGKATLAPGANALSTPGVLYSVSRSELAALDAAEGAGYRRDDAFAVTAADGSARECFTYIAHECASDLAPFDWYLALVIAGAREHRLCANHIARLAASAHAVDDDAHRASRKAALDALKTAGFASPAAAIS